MNFGNPLSYKERRSVLLLHPSFPTTPTFTARRSVLVYKTFVMFYLAFRFLFVAPQAPSILHAAAEAPQ